MAIPPQIKVFFFDVFGTCVQQRPAVAEELWKATKEALNSGSISAEVKAKAEKMTHDDWSEFGAEWNSENEKFVKSSIASKNSVDWVAVDNQRIELLGTMLADRGLVLLDGEKGSLFNPPQLEHLGKVWHRLPPWPDTVEGLSLLNKKFVTATLSNTYNDLIKGLVTSAEMPFKHTHSSDLFSSYKPNPAVYLGAADMLGVRPEECALVAAHLGDLKGAKACGLYAIYVERPLEEKAPALRKEDIPDLTVREGDGGFVELARRLDINHKRQPHHHHHHHKLTNRTALTTITCQTDHIRAGMQYVINGLYAALDWQKDVIKGLDEQVAGLKGIIENLQKQKQEKEEVIRRQSAKIRKLERAAAPDART